MTQTQPVETIPQPRHAPVAVPTAGQPYEYRRSPLVEPDWTRFPGWRAVTAAQWDNAQWQRVNCVKNVKQLRAVMGDLLDERFYADLPCSAARSPGQDSRRGKTYGRLISSPDIFQ